MKVGVAKTFGWSGCVGYSNRNDAGQGQENCSSSLALALLSLLQWVDGLQSEFRIEKRRPPQQQVEMDFKSLSASTVGAVHKPAEERTFPLPKWHKIQHSRFPLKLYTFTPRPTPPSPPPPPAEPKAEEALTTPKKKSIFKEEVARTNHAKQDSESSYHASRECKEVPRRKKARRARRKKGEGRAQRPAQVGPCL